MGSARGAAHCRALYSIMSTGRRGDAAVEIPASTKKVVLDLKEVVGNSEEEIYAMLKECNMDPNETAQRLLNQGTFPLPVSLWVKSFCANPLFWKCLDGFFGVVADFEQCSGLKLHCEECLSIFKKLG